MTDYLPKPVQPEDIENLLLRWFGDKHQEPAQPERGPQRACFGRVGVEAQAYSQITPTGSPPPPAKTGANTGLVARSLEAGAAFSSSSFQPAASPSEDAEKAVFDQEGLLRRIDGDVGLAKSLAARFLAEVPPRLQLLNAAIATGDLEAATKLAHAIKGAARNLGGSAVQDCAKSLELAGKEGDHKNLTTLLPVLEERFAKLRGILESAFGAS